MLTLAVKCRVLLEAHEGQVTDVVIEVAGVQDK